MCIPLLARFHSHAMFSRFKAPPATAADNGHNRRVDDNPYATNDPNRTAAGQGGVVQGFVLTKWLRLHLVDIVTMAIMGAIGLGVYYARNWFFRSASWIRRLNRL